MKLNRFERARVIGARSLQISMGAPIIIDAEESAVNPVVAAEREFREGVIPVTVRGLNRPTF